MPAKMLKRIERTCGSALMISSASVTPWASPPPPRSQKFAAPAARERDHVQRRHDEPGAVAENADLAVELHVGDVLLARRALLGRIGLEVAHLRDVGMLVERVVVDRELRVEGFHLAVRRHDQRVDLAEHRVGADEGVVEALDDAEDLLLLARIVDPGSVDQAAGLVGLEALEGVDVQAGKRLGPVGGDLLDVDPALLREHEERLLLAPVERDREVVLVRDVGGLLDPELADDVAVDVQAEDRLGVLCSLVGRVGELDPAGFPTAAGQHLGLDHDLTADLLGRGARFVRGLREPPLGDGDAEPLEELLALVLVEVHRAATLAEWGLPTSGRAG